MLHYSMINLRPSVSLMICVSMRPNLQSIKLISPCLQYHERMRGVQHEHYTLFCPSSLHVKFENAFIEIGINTESYAMNIFIL